MHIHMHTHTHFFYLKKPNFFLQLYCPNGISPMGNLGCFPQGKPAAQSCATQPTVHAWCFSVSRIHHTLIWTTGSLTCAQMLMHEIAHRGIWTNIRESALKVDCGGKIPCHTTELSLHQWHDSLMLYQWATSLPMHVHTRTHTCLHTRTHARVHTHTHAHTHTHTHTSKHAHSQPQTPSSHWEWYCIILLLVVLLGGIWHHRQGSVKLCIQKHSLVYVSLMPFSFHRNQTSERYAICLFLECMYIAFKKRISWKFASSFVLSD